MIRTPTTFVVGAGASQTYGLPVATALRSAALNMKVELKDLLAEVGIPRTALEEVLHDLRQHPATSIDAFLESRQQHAQTMNIGRHVIALMMAVAVGSGEEARLGNAHEDWIGYVIEQMREGAATPGEFAEGNSAVRFVTFNFDGIIEARLEKAVRAIYARSDTIAVDKAVQQVTNGVLHVHGRLPRPAGALASREHVAAHLETWKAWLPTASAEIRVVHDDISPTVLKTARTCVAGSTVLCFLGFAYATPNLARLGFPNMLARINDASIFGSAFGLSPGEQERVKGRFGGRIQLGGEQQGCLEVLRHFHVFRD